MALIAEVPQSMERDTTTSSLLAAAGAAWHLMARARELLDTIEQSITAVAAVTGYPDSFHLARQFRKVDGVTPFGYRGQRKG